MTKGAGVVNEVLPEEETPSAQAEKERFSCYLPCPGKDIPAWGRRLPGRRKKSVVKDVPARVGGTGCAEMASQPPPFPLLNAVE